MNRRQFLISLLAISGVAAMPTTDKLCYESFRFMTVKSNPYYYDRPIDLRPIEVGLRHCLRGEYGSGEVSNRRDAVA